MIELVVRADAESADMISDALLEELGALSVSVDDADADTPDEQAIYGEPGLPVGERRWPHCRLTALFADESAATQAAALVQARAGSPSLKIDALRPIAEQDWVRATQAQFAPVEITPEFWIVPSWHEVPQRARRVIRLDPGLAFGTGTHPTTRMCLRWTAEHAGLEAARWTRALDYGCGSGILAIAAALHGAHEVDAVDIDPAAVAATRANAQANGVRLRTGAPQIAEGRYALVYANILAAPLKLLAPLLCERVAPGGRLVLAGILERQIDELRDAYRSAFDLEASDRDDGWVLLTGVRS